MAFNWFLGFFTVLVFLRVDNKSVTQALKKPREFLAVEKASVEFCS